MTQTATPAPVTSRSGHRISAADAADMLLRHRDGVLPALAVFDVRDAARYAAAHIEGAEPLTEAGFLTVARRLPKTVPVLVYCYHGNASQTYAQMFADFRFPEVYSVDGGYEVFAAELAKAEAARSGSTTRTASLSPTLLEFLAAYGFDPDDLDATRAHGLTPLMRASLEGRADIVAELLAVGVSIARRNMDGNNALWLACVSSNAEVVRRLVAAGIDVDNRNDMGATALMYTASAGKADMVALLLECGADPQIPNFDDARAVDLAATRDCLKLLRHTLR
ncbi:ankyrin repeat domain-containing protein [Azoarcus olearius]|uniref:Rhodanese domain-containing protein n=1 Tax=Azoarcus sp. (strain BH72) TaxID=418699 RepID=A1K7U1_AZOSB|nr:ankyrin repeat domain-containing protein [Azoarcus olearius]ANQ85442.1 hypothetical protein dqs_2411 [Azoarcus olearius]CAL94896.1 conserved hypothetical protein [Azoarcus olearius]